MSAEPANATVVPEGRHAPARAPRWRPGGGLIGLVAVWRACASASSTMVMILTLAVGFTVLSGAEYAWTMRRVLAAHFRRRPIEAFRLLALSAVLPLIWFPALNDATGGHPYVVMALLAAELAVGGLDNSLTQAGRTRGAAWDLGRAVIQGCCGLCGGLVHAPLSAAPPIPGALRGMAYCSGAGGTFHNHPAEL